MAGDGSLDRQIVAALRRIIRAVDQHSKELAETFGLTAPQILVLQELVEAGPLATGILATRVQFAQATVSEILDRLEELELVHRRRSTVDRRRVESGITSKGIELLSRNPPLLQKRFVGELAKLTEWERSFLLAALQRVASMMSADGIDAAPLLASGPVTTSAEKTVNFLQEESKAADAEPQSRAPGSPDTHRS